MGTHRVSTEKSSHKTEKVGDDEVEREDQAKKFTLEESEDSHYHPEQS